MAEYISKESAISIFRAKAEMAVCTPAQPYFDRAAKMLELLPAADVAYVRHGRWCVDGVYVVCSVCNRFTLSPIVKRLKTFKYCPNCGAKMDLEVQDGKRRSNSDS